MSDQHDPAARGDSEKSRRPAGLVPPAHLSPSPPVPAPAAPAVQQDPDRALSPTRYGDWEKDGIAIDF